MAIGAPLCSALIAAAWILAPRLAAQEPETTLLTWNDFRDDALGIDFQIQVTWELERVQGVLKPHDLTLVLAEDCQVHLGKAAAIKSLASLDFFRDWSEDPESEGIVGTGHPTGEVVESYLGGNAFLDRLIVTARDDFQMNLVPPRVRFVFEDSDGGFAVVYELPGGELRTLGNEAYLFGDLSVCEPAEEETVRHQFETAMFDSPPGAISTLAIGKDGIVVRTRSTATGVNRFVRLLRVHESRRSEQTWAVSAARVRLPEPWFSRTGSARLQADTLLGACAISLRAQLLLGLHFDVSLLLDFWQSK